MTIEHVVIIIKGHIQKEIIYHNHRSNVLEIVEIMKDVVVEVVEENQKIVIMVNIVMLVAWIERVFHRVKIQVTEEEDDQGMLHKIIVGFFKYIF